MFKCLDCGHIFEEGEQKTHYENRDAFFGASAHEVFSCCPVCNGSYKKADRCILCDKIHFSDDLVNGVCKDCAEKSVTYDSALEYLLTRDELKDFCYYFLKQKEKGTNEDEVKNEAKQWFKRQVLEDKIFEREDFLSKVKEYILWEDCEWTKYLSKEVNK